MTIVMIFKKKNLLIKIICLMKIRCDVNIKIMRDLRERRATKIQSGCCKPPTACGYNFVNPTLWQNPTNMAADADCYLWNNDQSQLCYNCNSCKAGLLGNLRKDWRKANLILIITVVVLIWVYVIACSAFRNAQTEDLFRKYKQGWV
ncbi:BnaAnng20190D [Brassica napus]|uniref:(rape) hypothetical protein n=1 Tax=Brassica napus TaxID=3708 RepID=A0A078JHD0_BRANA|nr:unnamed protein product [Brassica napus]CDY65101.1 BnaAnng20190D [Brassica napus]